MPLTVPHPIDVVESTYALCRIMELITHADSASRWSDELTYLRPPIGKGDQWDWIRESRVLQNLPGSSSQAAWCRAFIEYVFPEHREAALSSLLRAARIRHDRNTEALAFLGAIL